MAPCLSGGHFSSESDHNGGALFVGRVPRVAGMAGAYRVPWSGKAPCAGWVVLLDPLRCNIFSGPSTVCMVVGLLLEAWLCPESNLPWRACGPAAGAHEFLPAKAGEHVDHKAFLIGKSAVVRKPIQNCCSNIKNIISRLTILQSRTCCSI